MQEQPLVACHAMPHPPMATLAIDVGGSGLKATVLDEHGRMLCDRVRVATPVGEPPAVIVALLGQLVGNLPEHERVAVGFPGMVRHGVVLTAPNLGHDDWRGFDLAKALEAQLGKPARVANDADVQGLAVISGKGVEMVLTLGTGFGTALCEDGHLCPHLEISQQPFRKGENYDQQLGDAARKAVGTRKWQKRVLQAIDNMRELTHFDMLYIGGGNAKKLDFELPADVRIVDNSAGLSGGAALWRS